MNQKFRIAIFASGSGSNAEKIANYFNDHPRIEIVVVMTNNPQSGVFERAKKLNLPAIAFNTEDFATSKVLEWLKEYQVTHIVLAGFLWLIPAHLLKVYPERIINIHPALLPKFGGKGMYGMKIHKLVKQLNEKETGITIHIVNDLYDEGRVLYQGKCEIADNDTAEQIANKVHQLEYACYPKIIENWILGENIMADK